ncbi:TetR/AcrR family transcriptional regulator [Edaphobacter sp. HDX4]|uniref:TetR/AcrR family transcriptional regulator n=1 Tax=Edaphobacter sp. HDX4 TaxID=2794064 RepID=UPI002FE6044D
MTRSQKPLSTKSPSPTGSRQALRTERTRAALLKSAEDVFARDGFEASRIEDIATEAGRSRGAFYANFANKTEVFLALRTVVLGRQLGEVRDIFKEIQAPEALDRAIYTRIAQQVRDTKSILLEIEFKLFALRHPEMLAELSERHFEASISSHREGFKDLADFRFRQLNEDEIGRITLAVSAVLEGFALNHLFSPGLLTPEYLESILPTMLAEILPKENRAPH